ncbi:MAG: hypothetical protein AAF639_05815 [Chloroflexota bacterium]
MTTNTQTSTMESSNQSNQQAQSWLPSKGNVLFTLCAIGVAMATLLYALSTGVIQVTATGLNQPAANAPSTNIIPYQGRLADADGNPLTATVDMHFRLYDTAEGGTPLWAEAWTDANGVQVTDGLFNVMLGSMTPISATVMSENSSLFLGLAAGDDDEMTPRVQLGSVPFAMQGWRVPDGSVTAEKLAEGLIQSHIVTAPQSFWNIPRCVGGTRDSDSAWTTISGLSLDVTLDEPGTVWIDSTGLGKNGGGGRAVYTNIFINGARTTAASGITEISGCRSSANSTGSDWCGFANISSAKLEPGTHTIETRVWCDGSGAQTFGGTLRALVLP